MSDEMTNDQWPMKKVWNCAGVDHACEMAAGWICVGLALPRLGPRSVGESGGLRPGCPRAGGAVSEQPSPAGLHRTLQRLGAVSAFPNLSFPDPVGLLPGPATNRLYVHCRQGQIYFFDPAVSSKTVFLDLSAHARLG